MAEEEKEKSSSKVKNGMAAKNESISWGIRTSKVKIGMAAAEPTNSNLEPAISADNKVSEAAASEPTNSNLKPTVSTDKKVGKVSELRWIAIAGSVSVVAAVGGLGLLLW